MRNSLKLRRMELNKNDFRRLPYRLIVTKILQKYIEMDLDLGLRKSELSKRKLLFQLLGYFKLDRTRKVFQLYAYFRMSINTARVIDNVYPPPIVRGLYLRDYPEDSVLLPRSWLTKGIRSIAGGWFFDKTTIDDISKIKDLEYLEVSKFLTTTKEEPVSVYIRILEVMPNLSRLFYFGSRINLVPGRYQEYVLSGSGELPKAENTNLLTYETCFFQERVELCGLKRLRKLVLHNGMYCDIEIQGSPNYTKYCRRLSKDLLQMTTIKKMKIRNMRPLSDNKERDKFYAYDHAYDQFSTEVCVSYRYQVKVHCNKMTDVVYLRLLSYLMNISLVGIVGQMKQRVRSMVIELSHINEKEFLEQFSGCGFFIEFNRSKTLPKYCTMQYWSLDEIRNARIKNANEDDFKSSSDEDFDFSVEYEEEEVSEGEMVILDFS